MVKVHSHQLLRACLLDNKRKLPPPACQVQLGLPSVACHPRGVQFPGNMCICNQGPLSRAWANCISCVPSACSLCRCCCPLQCNRRHKETPLNSAGGPGPYHRSWSSSYLHLLSVLSPPLLPFKSSASWHIPWAIQWSQTGNHRLTPTVWWGCPQSSPGLSWPTLSAWDQGSCPFPMPPPYPCRGRQ